MVYREGGVITAKKAHPCGGDRWMVMRVGADVKLKCMKCGRILCLSGDEVKKMTKSYFCGETENGKNKEQS